MPRPEWGGATNATDESAQRMAALVRRIADLERLQGGGIAPVNQNFFINGDSLIFQRGGVRTIPTNGGYTDTGVDMFQQACGGTSMTTQAGVADFGIGTYGTFDREVRFGYFFTQTAGAVAPSYQVTHMPIEDVGTLAGETVTVSFWVLLQGGATWTPTMNLIQKFGNGGSPSPNVFTGMTCPTIPVGSAWTKIKSTVTLPTVAGKTRGNVTNTDSLTWEFFWPVTTLAMTGYIVDLKIERGRAATIHVPNSIPESLAKCQRYCYVLCNNGANRYGKTSLIGRGVAWGPNNCQIVLDLPTTMRDNPVITVGGPMSEFGLLTNFNQSPSSLSGNGFINQVALNGVSGTGMPTAACVNLSFNAGSSAYIEASASIPNT